MKLKRIALSIVAGAALMVPVALTGQSQNSSIVQASTLKNKITFVKSYSQPIDRKSTRLNSSHQL